MSDNSLIRKIERWMDSSAGLWTFTIVGIAGMAYIYVSFLGS